MNSSPPKPTMRYVRFLLSALMVTGLVAVLGSLPTWRMAGSEGVLAMLAGCGISLVASAMGAIPVTLASGRPPNTFPHALMGAMALRFVVVAVVTPAVALSGLLSPKPLLIWVAISYGAQLVVDTRFAMRAICNRENAEK
jgi:hypothetical protein